MSTTQITDHGNGRGNVVINGHDLSDFVVSYDVSGGVGRRVTITLELRANDVTTLGAERPEVLMHPGLVELLQKAGWTPPGHPGLADRLVLPEVPAQCGNIRTTGKFHVCDLPAGHKGDHAADRNAVCWWDEEVRPNVAPSTPETNRTSA